MTISDTFLDARISKTEEIIVAYEDVILKLATGGAQEEYLLDTGQSRQRVKRTNLNSLNKELDSLYNRLSVLCNRRDGTGSFYGRSEGK